MSKIPKLDIEALQKIMPVLNEEAQRNIIGGTHVIINVQRYGFGSDTTASYFTATAYDDNGNVIGSQIGYMLEPATEYSLCNVAGSDTSICAGTYSMSYYNNHYYVNGVNGRSGIQIHAGNNGGDTSGCLMPGDSIGFSNENYYIPNTHSGGTTTALYEFLNKYSGTGITITIQ
jgi:hypothetical protein